MRTEDILMCHPSMRDSVVAFVHMDGDVVGKVLPRLGKATGSDVIHNGRRVQIFLLNDRLRSDTDFQLEVWRRIDRICPLSEDARRLGLTLEQLVLMHLLQAVERVHAMPIGRDTFSDTLDWWRTRAGRQTWMCTALELRAMWGQGGGSNCAKDQHRDN